MKTALIIAGLLLELWAGVRIGEERSRTQVAQLTQELKDTRHDLEWFTSGKAWDQAEKVSRITGTDRWQVLTGRAAR